MYIAHKTPFSTQYPIYSKQDAGNVFSYCVEEDVLDSVVNSALREPELLR